MREVFVDTGGWVALKHKGDLLWRAANTLNTTLLRDGARYITTNFILDEAYTLLLQRIGHHVAVELGEEIAASRLITVVHISVEMEAAAWQLFKRYSDKQFSFTDCTSFIVMQQRGIWEAFANDHHFEQVGYQILLK